MERNSCKEFYLGFGKHKWQQARHIYKHTNKAAKSQSLESLPVKRSKWSGSKAGEQKHAVSDHRVMQKSKNLDRRCSREQDFHRQQVQEANTHRVPASKAIIFN